MTRGKPKRFPKPAAPPKPAGAPVSDAPAEDTEVSYSAEPRQDERLQKIIAAAGLTSRRKAEELILSGRVQVNGATVTELGTKADAARDHIRVDGKLLRPVDRFHYYILNKPKGYITSASDPEGRPTVMEFFERTPVRVYPVGRLDYQSEGLLVMTNDGELANLLTKASSKVEKTYLVKIAGVPSEAALQQLRAGIMIERGKPGSHEGRVLTQPARIRIARDAENPWYEVILTEGRNREIRKMFEEIGPFVEKIRRVGYGPLVLDISPGEIRELDSIEVTALQRAARGIISRVRPPAIKLPAARRAVPHRPKSPATQAPAADLEAPRPAPSLRSMQPTRATRPPHSRPEARTSRGPESLSRRKETKTVDVELPRPAPSPSASRNRRLPVNRSDTRPALGNKNARTFTPNSGEQPSIDPRTGSPYRVLFGDRPDASKSSPSRKPATFDLRKLGAPPSQQTFRTKAKSGSHPPTGARTSSNRKPERGARPKERR
jgi:23S rRNA pseudouridine2605 synthase